MLSPIRVAPDPVVKAPVGLGEEEGRQIDSLNRQGKEETFAAKASLQVTFDMTSIRNAALIYERPRK